MPLIEPIPFTLFELERFLSCYNQGSRTPLFFVRLRDSDGYSCLSLEGKTVQIHPVSIVYNLELLEDERINEHVRDYLNFNWDAGLSMFLHFRVLDLEAQWRAAGVECESTILLIIVSRFWGGEFTPVPKAFSLLKTTFSEVWVWTANDQNELKIGERALQSVYPVVSKK